MSSVYGFIAPQSVWNIHERMSVSFSGVIDQTNRSVLNLTWFKQVHQHRKKKLVKDESWRFLVPRFLCTPDGQS
jgi:hypothetical protein